jgi:Nucleotidyl transferase AbiEii toxin, Type IV TA system
VTSVSDGQQSLALTNFQIQVAQLFFALPAAQGFLLAGGAALIAQHLTSRPTQDLDFFTRVGASVPAARDALETAASARGWSIERVRDEATFCRLVIHGDDDLLVDLALDSPPEHPATASLIGPTFAPQELAGRKVVALFDRAEARDFADVFELSQHFSKNDLLEKASEVDRGFDRHFFAGHAEGFRGGVMGLGHAYPAATAHTAPATPAAHPGHRRLAVGC